MTKGTKVILRVPGAEVRYGTYVAPVENVTDMGQIAITHFEDNKKIKQLGPNQLYTYLANMRDVEEIKDGNPT